MEHFDIVIIGGGVAGLSLAAFLSPGQKVLLLEAERATGYHATGRSAAEFVLGHNAPDVCRLAKIAKHFFDHPPEGFSDIPLLAPLGCIMIAGADKIDSFAPALARESAINPRIREISRDEALALAPILNVDQVERAYHDPDFWTIEVENLLQGYIRTAKRKGFAIRTDARVSAVTRNDDLWTIDCGGQSLTAKIVVNASGGWADQVAQTFGIPPLGIVPHRRTAVLVDMPEGVSLAGMPEICEIDDDFYMKPDGGRLMASPCDETPCVPADVQPEEIDIAWAAHHVSETTMIPVRRVAKSWAGMRTFSPDRLPVVGFSSQVPGFFWLAGQGGYGILTSPALGNLAACLIEGRELPHIFAEANLTAAPFSPQRFGG